MPVADVACTAHLPGARLFTFGDVDGPGGRVRLQHPLGVVYYQGRLYVADTYNNKIKVVDPTTGFTRTVAGPASSGSGEQPVDLDEPGGITAAAGKLFVADTNNHAVRVIDLQSGNRVSTLELRAATPP